MGGVASAICNPCGASHAAAKVAEPVLLNAPGYDWTEPQKPTRQVSTPRAGSKLEPAAPPPEPAAPPPEPEAPKPPPKPAPTTPITVDTLQGEWVNSMGAKIKVVGTLVSLNGMEMKVHPVTVDESGVVVSIGKIWQLNGWLEDEKIEWKECPSREVMEFARSVVWTKATAERMVEWTAQMAGLGYTGSANDCATGNRGVEGCCPGTCDAKAKIAVDNEDKDKAELKILNDLVQKYRVSIERIPPRRVIPDYSNRGHTGLSVEHVHYLANRFLEKGFIKRNGNDGHDVPVLVRESRTSDLGAKSIANWRDKIAEEPGFPPKEHYEKLFGQDVIYTSLGNGHFNQALNLFFVEGKSIYGDKKYFVGNDHDLKEAVYKGVPAIILSADIPLRDRETIAQLLNSKREYKWCIGPNGEVDILGATEDTTQCKQFEALSKVLDAVELNCLVRSELGVKESHRIGQ